MAENRKYVLAMVIVGGLMIALSFLLQNPSEEKPSLTQTSLARAEYQIGQAWIQRQGKLSRERIDRTTPVFHEDILDTGADGRLVLEFTSAYRVRLLENTLVVISDEKDYILLTIQRGDVEVENFGREGSLYIANLGQRWTASEYELEVKKKFATAELPDQAPQVNPELTTQTTEGLDPAYLQSVLKAHRPGFFRCYTQVLQKNSQLKGNANISFTIENNGKISQPKLVSSDIQDPQFKSCLIEAMNRVQFRAFTGKTITTVFPLRFE